jgi:hypothetical protein
MENYQVYEASIMHPAKQHDIQKLNLTLVLALVILTAYVLVFLPFRLQYREFFRCGTEYIDPFYITTDLNEYAVYSKKPS